MKPKPKLTMLKPGLQVLPDRLRALPAPSKRDGHRISGRKLQDTRRRIWIRDSGACGECGLLCSPSAFELDHKVPLDRGGTHADENLQVLHVDCHQAKTARELGYKPGGESKP